MSNYLGDGRAAAEEGKGGRRRRRVLVTDGATGIGAAPVKVLTEAGANVVATYHRAPPPSQDGVTWVRCDVRDAAAVDEMVTGAAETLGGLDVLLSLWRRVWC
jgi:3-oxoacyl-[acyl-carrier protein] reductase